MIQKSLFLTLCATTLLALSNDEKIEKLTAQMKAMEAEIATLKQEQIQAADDAYDYTENVETKVLEDKIKFSLAMKFSDDSIEKEYANAHNVHSNNILSTKFMLNMRADITPTLKFHGRLSMYKYWGSSIVHPYSYFDNMQGRVPSDSALYVERAYVDWYLYKDSILPVALTIGRQPSSDGPSHQFKDNTTRKGTYSALLYDGAADGAVVTLNLSRLLHYNKTYLRLGYSKGFGYIESNNYVGNAYIGASNDDIKDTNVYGVFLDTKLPGLADSLVQISYSQLKDIIANPLDKDYSNNKNIGDMQLFGAMAEASNIADTHLDLFVHYGYNKTKPNGTTYQDPAGNQVGLLGDGKERKSGYAYWLGGRYTFDKHKHWKCGFEYNHGSQNWLNLTQGSFDLYNKLATRGDAYETYFMYAYNRYLNFRVGYLDIDYKYRRSGWFVGAAEEITPQSSSVPNEQSDLTRLKALYLKMNLVY